MSEIPIHIAQTKNGQKIQFANTTNAVYDSPREQTVAESLTDIYSKIDSKSADWGSINGDINDQTDLINALNLKQDTEEGKGLSTNDFTDAYKTALDTYEERYDELVDTVETAANNANQKADDANNAATLAQQAAQEANEKANLAQNAATTAMDKAYLAQDAAISASIAATNANNAAEAAMEAATQVVNIVKGYYHQGAFYEEASHTTLITPSTSKLYYDLTDGANLQGYLYNGTAYEKVGSTEFNKLNSVEPQPSRDELIHQEIRQHYTENDEFMIMRQYIANPSNTTFATRFNEYNAFVEEVLAKYPEENESN